MELTRLQLGETIRNLEFQIGFGISSQNRFEMVLQSIKKKLVH